MKTVLFLCTGNSARSILSEAYLNAQGGDRFKAFSAGSTPTGKVNPFAIETLLRAGVITQADAEGFRSKVWDEFAGEDAPVLDIVITVCDNAAGEVCPIWKGPDGAEPVKYHWSIEDPAAATGSDDDKRKAFEIAFDDVRGRIDAFLAEMSQ